MEGKVSRSLAWIAVVALLFVPAGSAQQAGEPDHQQQQQQQQQPPPQKPPEQQTTDQEQLPTFRAGINFVRVDVIVTDKNGEPVVDLAPEDFQVSEDGKAQKIETFKLVRIAGTSAEPPRQIRTLYDEETEAAREDVRLIAIFLDDYHVRRGGALVVREPLVRFIENALSPNDLVALMYPLTPVNDLRLTRNHASVIEAIRKFEGRKYDYRPRNLIEEQYAMYPASVVERIRNEVSLTALRGLVTRLGGLREGRKAVILVSEGYTNYLPPQLRDPVAGFPGLGNPARGRPGYGDPVEEERSAWLVNTDIHRGIRDVFAEANRHNAAIYALDPRGLAVNEYDINEVVDMDTDRASLQATMDTLRVLANETDGRAIVNRNDLEGGLKQVVKDSSAYYLIGYSSSEAPSDGKFHEIEVKVKRPGVQVRSRKGYWALTAEERDEALAPPRPEPEPAVTEALSSIAVPRGRMTRHWIGTARGENGRTVVTFAWEAVPPPPGTPSRGEPRRVMLTASGPDGEVYFRGRVPEGATSQGSFGAASAAAGARAGTSEPPVQAQARFEVDPGRLQLRISVEGAASEVLDSETRDLVVPDLTIPQLAISTPVVFRARNALEFRAIRDDAHAIPAATREFSRTDRLLVRFDVYAPGNAAPAPSARLLNRAGTPMTDIAVQPASVGTGYQVDLPLAGLAAGEYILEVSVKDGDESAQQLVGMRVTG